MPKKVFKGEQRMLLLKRQIQIFSANFVAILFPRSVWPDVREFNPPTDFQKLLSECRLFHILIARLMWQSPEASEKCFNYDDYSARAENLENVFNLSSPLLRFHMVKRPFSDDNVPRFFLKTYSRG